MPQCLIPAASSSTRAIITGAAGGIGRAVALALPAASWAGQAGMLLVDRDRERLIETQRGVIEAGARADILDLDLADAGAGAVIVERARQVLGGLDLLVSNAAVLLGAKLEELDIEQFDRVFAVNTRATWLLAKHAYGLLAESKGAIVATASISSEHPTPPLGAYAASKAALVMLVRQMALEWGPRGIRCNCVSPGPTLTPMNEAGYADAARRRQREQAIPLRRLGLAEEVAQAILFLGSPAAANITGQNLMVDGGLACTLMQAAGAGTGQTQAG